MLLVRISGPALQQPEVNTGPIPTDEATEADETAPATAPAADARSAFLRAWPLTRPVNLSSQHCFIALL